MSLGDGVFIVLGAVVVIAGLAFEFGTRGKAPKRGGF